MIWTANLSFSSVSDQKTVQIMSTGMPEKRKKATIAMCNLCCESSVNRQNAGQAGRRPAIAFQLIDLKSQGVERVGVGVGV